MLAIQSSTIASTVNNEGKHSILFQHTAIQPARWITFYFHDWITIFKSGITLTIQNRLAKLIKHRYLLEYRISELIFDLSWIDSKSHIKAIDRSYSHIE